MLCPICKLELKMTDRQGIEIDYCPRCRGVWLDRGELDKIIERAASVNPPLNNPAYGAPPDSGFMPPPHRYDDDDLDDDARYRYRNQPAYQQGLYGQPVPFRKKREGFLGDLFDFD